MIKQIHLKGFGIHKDLTVQFKRGLNAIIGRNQHGKTNIMESICFGYFGKTQNSTLDKVINFDMERATVTLEDEQLKFSRTRSPNSSKLDGVDKLALEKHLNLGYPEFLSIFYISSHEQKSLFDPAYFRNFLISLFGLEVYSKKYERLSSEYQGLQAAVQAYKKVNIPLLQARFKRVQAKIQLLNESRQKYSLLQVKCQTTLNEIAGQQGEVRANWSRVTQKQNLLAQAKCTECGRPITPEYKLAMQTKIDEAKTKIQAVNKSLTERVNKANKAQTEIQNHIDMIDARIYKGRNILTRIQEKAKQQSPNINTARLKELEMLMPIFQASGFPSYLLKIYVPVIVESANNLLQMMFPDMRVSIRTEKPESGRPDFKVLVHKADKIQEISDLCGVERVMVNLCFRLGIMVIFKQLSKTNLDFFMVDEGFEKVDDINALEVLKLFENFISLGYLSQVILVTHKVILKQQKNINYIEL